MDAVSTPNLESVARCLTDGSSISKMTDPELAAWQFKYPKESPHFILAEQHWKYRAARKSAKFAALIAVVASLVGAVVGYTLRGSEEPPKNKTNQEAVKSEPPPITSNGSHKNNELPHKNP